MAAITSLVGACPTALAADPYEQSNLAAAHPEKVAAMQERLNALGREAAKPLALIYVAGVGLAHGKPLIPSEGGQPPVAVDPHGPAITDEGVGEHDAFGAPANKAKRDPR
ncbi:MAG: hypothetical protein M5U12_27505 [Verrucomicrobia bacterium]|nr:hypothetical protein [Verrucomicrobiota bacterium]